MTTPFDNYEISPCRRIPEPDKPGHFYFEPCEPHEADVWTLYGRIPEGGVEAIGDFDSREAAEEIAARIIGEPFTGYHMTRLRVMHAGPALLEALQALQTANGANNFTGWHPAFDEAIAKARIAIDRATTIIF